ncbi:MAG: ISAs1 family transposase, partial [Planctomycetota bacterium]
AELGECKQEWFETFLELPHGIPRHDTFARVFARLDPDAFEACFGQWMAHLNQTSQGRLIAVDGKTLRRSFDTATNKAAIHMINAWCLTRSAPDRSVRMVPMRPSARPCRPARRSSDPWPV